MQKVTPFEAWQGFDRKVVVDAELEGEGSQTERYTRYLTSQVSITGSVKGKKKTVSSIPLHSEPGHGVPNNSAELVAIYQHLPPLIGWNTFLLRASDFDAESVQLQGTIRIRQIAGLPTQGQQMPLGWQFSADKDSSERLGQPASFSIEVPQDLEPVDRTSPVLLKAEKTFFSPSSEKTGFFDGVGETQIYVKFKPFNVPANTEDSLSLGPTGIYDEKGKAVIVRPRRYTSAVTEFNGWQMFKDGTWELERMIPVWDIPASHGALWYLTYISRAGSWPTEVRIPLRTRKDLAAPKLLRVASVKVSGSDVKVLVTYLGNRSVATQIGTDSSDDSFFDMRRPDRTAYGQAMKDSENQARLISHWSEHLTAQNGKEYWFHNSVRIRSVQEVAPKTYEIVYATNALDALKEGQTMKFSAHVGIEGDGFWPVEATFIQKLSKKSPPPKTPSPADWGLPHLLKNS